MSEELQIATARHLQQVLALVKSRGPTTHLCEVSIGRRGGGERIRGQIARKKTGEVVVTTNDATTYSETELLQLFPSPSGCPATA